VSTVLSRPTAGSARPEEPEAGRPLAVSAALCGAVAAVVGLVLCMSVALTGWFLADAGAHGDTTDALKVGAVAWLVGHGAHLVLAGAPLGVTPLAVTMMLVLVAFRTGRWAARLSGGANRRVTDQAVGAAVAAFTGSYLVLVVGVGVLASRSAAAPGLGRALLGALLVAGLGGGTGLAAGSGLLEQRWGRLPGWASDVAGGALAAVLWLLAAGAALVGLALLLSFNEAATVMSGLHLSVGDALSYTVVMALFAPNAALLGVSYLTGPGFAFGAGTTVSPTAVSLGVVPAFPLLAALPDEGPTPGLLAGALVVPAAAAAIGAATALRRRPPIAHDLAALRGAAAGFVGGVLVTVLVSLAGGPLGTGRMADVGAPTSEVLVFATGLMSLGGLLGALGQNWWRRRRGEEPAEAAGSPAGRPAPQSARRTFDESADGSRPAVAGSQAHPRARSTSSRPDPARSSRDPGSDEPTVEVLR